MSFDQAWAVCEKIPGSFTHDNAEALWNAALSSSGYYVEVGVDQGRSASILLHAARQTGSAVLLVDSWEGILVDNYYKVLGLIRAFPDVDIELLRLASTVAVEGAPESSLVHIDACHVDGHPDEDCCLWLPKIKSGGFACFHDYESTFPEVAIAVNKHTAGWEVVGNFESLAVRKKP